MADNNTPGVFQFRPPHAWVTLGDNDGDNRPTSSNRFVPLRRAVRRTLLDANYSSTLWNHAAFHPPRETIASLSGQLPATQEEANDKNMEDSKQVPDRINVPSADFSSADKKLLDFGMHSDAKVIANGHVYAVHKSVLCTRSKWFRAALESDFMEGNSSVVKISAPDNIAQLLEFLYTGAVDLSLHEETQIMTAANELSVLGDFYQVDELKTYAERVLGQYLGAHLSAICAVSGGARLPRQYWGPHTLDLAKDYNYCPENYRIMKEAGFVDRLCAAIREAYAKPSGIHHVYVAFVCAARPHTFKCELIRGLRQELTEFGDDLLTAMMDGLDCSAFDGNEAFEKWKDTLSVEPRETYCGGCGQHGRHRNHVYA